MVASLALNAVEGERLQRELKGISAGVEAVLDGWLPGIITASGDRVLECMRYSTFAGGKRLRPALVVAASRLVGGGEAAALVAGSAMEMIHTYSLVQDDLPCMDDDDLRRGRPTAHKQFGETTAILASDGLQSGAYELLCDARVGDAETRLEVIKLFSRSSGALGMVLGQMVDMEWEWEQPAGLGLEDLARMNYLKTGMNITACCEAGIVVGNRGDTQMREAMRRFGDALGRAFQVYDDVLDVTGTAEELGKTPGKDEKAGKVTFVSLMGVEGARARAFQEAEKALAVVDGLGDEAELLRLIARFCVTRSS